MTMFKNRTDAGMQLAEKLKDFAGERDMLVFALPRGGIVPAAEIARELNAPLDVLIVRKIGHPCSPSLQPERYRKPEQSSIMKTSYPAGASQRNICAARPPVSAGRSPAGSRCTETDKESGTFRTKPLSSSTMA